MSARWRCWSTLVVLALAVVRAQAACRPARAAATAPGGAREPDDALEETPRGHKKALWAHIAYFIATKIFVLKIVYAIIFFVLLHKASYVVSWFFHYLKEVKKEKIHHHELHDDHGHYDYGSPHVEYGPPSHYGPKYVYSSPPQSNYGPPQKRYSSLQSNYGPAHSSYNLLKSHYGLSASNGAYPEDDNEPYKRSVYDADGSYSVKGA